MEFLSSMSVFATITPAYKPDNLPPSTYTLNVIYYSTDSIFEIIAALGKIYFIAIGI